MTRMMKRILLIVGMITAGLALLSALALAPLLITAFFNHNGAAAGWAIICSLVFPIMSMASATLLGILKR